MPPTIRATLFVRYNIGGRIPLRLAFHSYLLAYVRIAINAALIGNRHNGLTTSTVGLSEYLAQSGHDVVVYGSSPHVASLKGITLVDTPSFLSYNNGWLAALLRFAWNQTVLPVWLERDEIDIVLCHNAEGLLWSRVDQILVIHDLIPLLYPAETPRLHFYYKRLLPLVLKRPSAIVAVSQHSRDDLLRNYAINADKVHVVYNGISTEDLLEEYMPLGLKFERYFLFVGTFAPRKNLGTVTRAFARICANIPEGLLVVAYPDRWMSDYLRLVDDLGISHKVTILSALDEKELLFAYRHATALILLSEYEGFGLPALEAMHRGAPVIVSRSTSLTEVVGDAGVAVPPHDVEAVAEVMLMLSRDDRQRQCLRQRGEERARAFTWCRAAEQMDLVLSKVVEARSN